MDARLADLGDGLEAALSELRDLARGLHPPLLRDHGLPAALAAAAKRGSPPARLITHRIDRHPDDVETAVYFCCLEGLQNVRKHAGADAHAEIRLSQDADELAFEIIDDGIGHQPGAAGSAGTGLTNMRDRLVAVGGSLTIDASPGRGTRLHGRIPLRHGVHAGAV